MATKISTIKKGNDTVYPITKVECVYDDNNQNVKQLIGKVAPVHITTPINFNNMTTEGVYYIDVYGSVNCPDFSDVDYEDMGRLEVFTRSTGQVFQLFYAFYHTDEDADDCAIFYRLYGNDWDDEEGYYWYWRTWQKIPTNSDLSQRAYTSLSNVTYPVYVKNGVARTGTADRVIEMKVSSDGKTWYRKWKSGWKECGITYTGYSDDGVTFSLPISFSDANYTAVASISSLDSKAAVVIDNEVWFYTLGVYNKTKTSVRIEAVVRYVANCCPPFSLYCCGY